ncbi:MAG: PD-(D/E)XK nuclease family protein [Cetobacterium sp.]
MDKDKLEVYNLIRDEVRSRGKKVEFVSYSKVDKFLQCKLCYKLQYIDKIKVAYEANIHGDIGTLSGDIIRWASSESWGRDKAEKYFSDNIKSICLKHDLPTTLPVIQSMRAFFKDSFYMDELASRGVKLEFEKPVYKKLNYVGNDVDTEYWLVGFIDMLIHNEDGTVSIIDFKTSNVSGYTGKKREQSLVQLYSYAYLYEAMSGKSIKDVGYLFLKYCNLTFEDSKGKKRKSSKVERRHIMEEYRNKDGASSLEMSDCLDLFDYSSNRLAYMKIFMDNFVSTKKEENFEGDGFDSFFCKNFCSFRSTACTYKGEVVKEPNPMEIMVGILNGRLV